jgi:hypothetical protein
VANRAAGAATTGQATNPAWESSRAAGGQFGGGLKRIPAVWSMNASFVAGLKIG